MIQCHHLFLTPQIYQQFGASIHDDNVPLLIARLHDEDLDRVASVSGFLLVCVMMYFILCSVNIRYFNCHMKNGQLMWFPEPSTKCFDFANKNLHATMLPVVVLGMTLFVCGIPVTFAYLLLKHRRVIQEREAIVERLRQSCRGDDERLGGSRVTPIAMASTSIVIMKMMGFAFKRYHSIAFFYELLVMLRKVCIVMSVLLQNAIEQVTMRALVFEGVQVEVLC